MLPLRQTPEQLARETNVVLLRTNQPRTKVIESRQAECNYARGTVVCVPEKKAHRGEQTEKNVLVPLCVRCFLCRTSKLQSLRSVTANCYRFLKLSDRRAFDRDLIRHFYFIFRRVPEIKVFTEISVTYRYICYGMSRT